MHSVQNQWTALNANLSENSQRKNDAVNSYNTLSQAGIDLANEYQDDVSGSDERSEKLKIAMDIAATVTTSGRASTEERLNNVHAYSKGLIRHFEEEGGLHFKNTEAMLRQTAQINSLQNNITKKFAEKVQDEAVEPSKAENFSETLICLNQLCLSNMRVATTSALNTIEIEENLKNAHANLTKKGAEVEATFVQMTVIEKKSQSALRETYRNELNSLLNNMEALFNWLVQECCIEAVDALISLNISIDSRDVSGLSFLAKAIFFGKVRLANLLIEHASLQVLDDEHRSLLHLAALSGNVHMVKLVQGWEVDSSRLDAKGWTCLHAAASTGKSEILACFWNDSDLNHRDKQGRLPSDIAALYFHPNLIKMMNPGMDDHTLRDYLRTSCDKEGTPLVLQAVSLKLIPIASQHVTFGAPIHSRDAKGNTILHYAVATENIDVVRWALSLDHAALGSIQNDEGLNAISAALNKGLWEIALCIMRSGVALEKYDLHLACRSGKTLPDWLLAKKENDLELKDDQGNTPLLCVIRSGNCAALDQLLSKKADAQVRNQKGEGVLEQAVLSRNLSMLDKVLSHLFSVIGDQNRHRALFLAIKENLPTFISRLVLANIQMQTGMLHLAAKLGYRDCVRTILPLLPDNSEMNKSYKDKTPIRTAIEYNHFDCAIEIGRSLKLSLTEIEQKQLMMRAIQIDDCLAFVRWLSENYKRDLSMDCLLQAIESKRFQVAQFLVKSAYLKKNVQNINPLCSGVKSLSKEMVGWVLSIESEFLKYDRLEALELAVTMGQLEIADVILSSSNPVILFSTKFKNHLDLYQLAHRCEKRYETALWVICKYFNCEKKDIPPTVCSRIEEDVAKNPDAIDSYFPQRLALSEGNEEWLNICLGKGFRLSLADIASWLDCSERELELSKQLILPSNAPRQAIDMIGTSCPSLTSVILRGRFNPGILVNLSSALPRLKVLGFKAFVIGDDVHSFAGQLSAWKGLQELQLIGCDLNASKIETLCGKLGELKNLKKLVLQNNQLQAQHVSSLIQTISGMQALEWLDLSYNELNDVSVLGGVKLLHLDLRHNRIGYPELLSYKKDHQGIPFLITFPQG